MILLSPTSCLRQPRPQSHAASLNQRAAYHTVRNDVKLADVDLVVFSCVVIDEAQCSLRARGGFSDAALDRRRWNSAASTQDSRELLRAAC